jgi:hypothetical protein
MYLVVLYLGYSAVRLFFTIKHAKRKNKYDADDCEWWVELRTSGTLTRLEVESINDERVAEGHTDTMETPPRMPEDQWLFGKNETSPDQDVGPVILVMYDLHMLFVGRV